MLKREALAQRLEKERERTKTDIERLKQELQEEIEPASATDDDAADAAAAIYERAKTISLIQTREEHLHEVEDALERIEEGTYGICQRCGEKISEDRLEIVPEAALCVRCAAERERGLGGRGRNPQHRRRIDIRSDDE